MPSAVAPSFPPHAPCATGGLVFFALTTSAALAVCAVRRRKALAVSAAGAAAWDQAPC